MTYNWDTCIHFDSRPFCHGSWTSLKCWSYIIKKVEDMSITADSPLVRRECRQVSGPVTFSWWCPIHSNLVINFRQLLCSSYEFNMMFVYISNYKMCVFYFYVNLHIRLNFCYAKPFILQIALQYILEFPLGKLLNKHLEFYVTQLTYEMEMGRECWPQYFPLFLRYFYEYISFKRFVDIITKFQ